MAIKDILKTYRTWEDGLALLLGLMIGLTPWMCSETANSMVVVNAAVSGLVLLLLAQLELVHFRRWEEVLLLACGIWVAASPSVLSYDGEGQARFWHWGLGGLVALLAALEIWQDWQGSDVNQRHP